MSRYNCTGNGVYIPTTDPCGECGSFEQEIEILKDRVSTLEELLAGKTDTQIAMTDANNNEVTITVLAEQEA